MLWYNGVGGTIHDVCTQQCTALLHPLNDVPDNNTNTQTSPIPKHHQLGTGAWALPEPLFMTSFCPPDPRRALYTIGRTMFETDRLAANHVERCNMMSEIWVPTEFHKQVFIHSGVAPGKLHVLGEAVDVDHFDPAKTMPSGLKFAVRVFGPQRDKEVAKYFRFLSVRGFCVCMLGCL